ncbi:MAG: rod shape-determining protein MreD [Octadecabacter sp.]|jgi:rod shape-determining protein MreD
MADNTLNRRRRTGRLTFLFIGLFIVFSHLIPLETVPPSLGSSSLVPLERHNATSAANFKIEEFLDPIRWIAPNFLILLAVTWVTRRPSFAPIWVIAVLFLLADFLFQRPPGLWTALVLILTEILRGRSRSIRSLPFWLEWVTVAIGITVISSIYRLTLLMVLVPQGPLGLTILQLGLTLVTYPVVVFVSYALFGVNRPAPGEVDALGHRI